MRVSSHIPFLHRLLNQATATRTNRHCLFTSLSSSIHLRFQLIYGRIESDSMAGCEAPYYVGYSGESSDGCDDGSGIQELESRQFILQSRQSLL